MKNSNNNLNNEKPYYSFSDYAKNKFKIKVGKISINTDFGCAHKLNEGGCRFCNLESYKPPYIKEEDIENQWLNGIKNYGKRYKKYYGYFQLGTPLSKLASKESLFYASKLIKLDDCVGLMFGARSDMLEEKTLKTLNDLAKETDKEIWLETGLQSSNDETLNFINRGHNYQSFVESICNIKENYKNLIICVHLIFGLPKRIENNKIILEDKNDILKTVKDISKLKIDAVKFHQLDIVKGSDFENIYNRYNFPTLDENFYIELTAEVLGFMQKNIIIARLTGDSLGDTLIAPKWKKSKGEIINGIIKKMNESGIKQGDLLKI